MSGSFLLHHLPDQAYWLYLPPPARHSTPLPLLVMLHGCSQTAVEFAQGTRMNQHAQRQRFAVLYPEQERSTNTLRCWNWFEPETQAGRGDTSAILQALQDVLRRHPIERSQVHLVGFSAGAAMAALISTTHAALFSGCAMHSGIMTHAASSAAQAAQIMRRGAADAMERSVSQIVARQPQGSRLVPSMVIHGSEDFVVHPINAQQITEQIRMVALQLSPEALAPGFDSGRWIEGAGRPYRLQDMRSGSTLLLRNVLIEGLGHAWSGGESRHEYFDSNGPDATQLILEFLLPHRSHDAG